MKFRIKRVFFLIVFCAMYLHLSAQYHPEKKKFVFGYWMDNGSDHSWKHLHLEGQLHVDLSNIDTICFSMNQRKHFFSRISTTEFASEPQIIRGFHLLGVYGDAVNLPGIFILFYLDEEKGLLRKYYFRPGHLAFCDYNSFTPTNPFSGIVWSQSMNDKVMIKDTIQTNSFGRKIKP